MNKKYIWISIILIILILAASLFVLMPRDGWTKNSIGIYVKNGNPTTEPDYVKNQQNAIFCGLTLFNNAKLNGTTFDSQCLGTCKGYAVDIVHVPRTAEDNLPENECIDYLNGKVIKFIELDNSGEVIRVVD